MKYTDCSYLNDIRTDWFDIALDLSQEDRYEKYRRLRLIKVSSRELIGEIRYSLSSYIGIGNIANYPIVFYVSLKSICIYMGNNKFIIKNKNKKVTLESNKSEYIISFNDNFFMDKYVCVIFPNNEKIEVCISNNMYHKFDLNNLGYVRIPKRKREYLPIIKKTFNYKEEIDCQILIVISFIFHIVLNYKSEYDNITD